MKINILMIATTALLIVFSAALVHSQEEMRVVDHSVFGHPLRPPATFVHDAHNEKAGIDDCAECHHLYDDRGQKLDDASSEDQRCADCHAPAAKGRVPGLRQAFHGNCKGCHLKMGKGPVVCAQCHVRGPKILGAAP